MLRGSRSIRTAELVVYANADDVESVAASIGEEAAGCGRASHRHGQQDTAAVIEIHIEIFELHRPMVINRVFETDTGGPAHIADSTEILERGIGHAGS